MNIEAYERILPEIDDANREYWNGLDAGELRLQQCDDDKSYRFPASPVCPKCLSTRFTWRAASGRATLWSWIVMHQKYYEAFDDERPYTIAFVRLEEGPFMMSTVVDDVAELHVDAALQLAITAVGQHSSPRFRLAP
jgi:uncharacterized OB-fold protein